MILGLIFNTNSLLVNGLIVVITARTAARMSAAPLAARLSRYVAATVLAGFAIRLAITER